MHFILLISKNNIHISYSSIKLLEFSGRETTIYGVITTFCEEWATFGEIQTAGEVLQGNKTSGTSL